VNVSLSSLVAELHSSLNVIQGVASGYLLSLALMLPLSGWLVDRSAPENSIPGLFWVLPLLPPCMAWHGRLIH
jgi:MFS family permease